MKNSESQIRYRMFAAIFATTLFAWNLQPSIARAQIPVVAYHPPPDAAVNHTNGSHHNPNPHSTAKHGGADADNFWSATGNAGTTPGTNFLGTTDDQPLELKVDGQRALRLEATTNAAPNVIGGADVNYVAPGVFAATIAGGGVIIEGDPLPNVVQAAFGSIGGGGGNGIWGTFARASTIAGGWLNSLAGSGGAIAGGEFNRIDGSAEQLPRDAAIGGGYFNFIGAAGSDGSIGGGALNFCLGRLARVGGGSYNVATGLGAFVGGGAIDFPDVGFIPLVTNNLAQGENSVVAGGLNNTASGDFSAIPGGDLNLAQGASSFAAGHRARAAYLGDFVWADSTDADFSSSNSNQFAARCTGGAAFVTAVDGAGNTAAGVLLQPGSGSWSSLSDRNAKENFKSVDAREVLTRVAAIPITTWNYKTQDKSIRHLGPVAEDFRVAFGVGEDGTHIANVDEEGVALAAIQGLNQKVQEMDRNKDDKIQNLRQQNAALEQRLEKLERLLDSFHGNDR
jgi:hypothetical protein